MRRWALGVVLAVALPAAAQPWATATPRPPTRTPAPPAATRTPTPAATAPPRPTSTPPASATRTPQPTPHAGLNYYLVPLVPVLTPKVGESLRYADGTPIYLTVRLASGEIKATIVRVDP